MLGYLFQRAFGPGQGGVDVAYAATTCLGAFAGSILASGGLNTWLRRDLQDAAL